MSSTDEPGARSSTEDASDEDMGYIRPTESVIVSTILRPVDDPPRRLVVPPPYDHSASARDRRAAAADRRGAAFQMAHRKRDRPHVDGRSDPVVGRSPHRRDLADAKRSPRPAPRRRAVRSGAP